jgi:hypothetical protein
MNFNRFAIATFALVLGVTGMSTGHGYAAPTGAAFQDYGQDRGGWDTPPQELQDIQRQGFRDGIIGAQKDIGNHRRPDPNNRDEFRHPRLPREQWEAYQDGFRRGYERGIAHLTGQDQQMPQREPDRDGPGMGRDPGRDMGREYGPGPGNGPGAGPGSELRLRGFQDGMDGALKDLGNHRRPDPNNRDEYRHPNNVPYQLQDVYRDGFQRGYQRGIDLLTGGPGSDRRYQGTGMEIRTRGFQDGAEGAIKDFGNNRQPDPNNRDEYRHPNDVPYELQDAYRDGFERGYQVVARELMGYSGRH